MDLDPRGAHAPSPAAGTVPAELVEHAPEGLAVIDADARFVEANPAAVVLCGLRPGAVTGTRSPFPAPGGDAGGPGRRVDRGVAAGAGRSARVRLRAQPDARPAAVGGVVPGRDREPAAPAEAGRHRQGRVQRGLQAVPRGHARDARPRGAADGLARRRPGAHDEPGGRPAARHGGGRVRPRSRLLRQAHGVPRPRRPAGHARGARDRGSPSWWPTGTTAIQRDPAWAPLHELMRHPRWDWFASVPLLARGEPVGILNAFFAPGQTVGDTELDFLLAMAEQAAMAVDHAALLDRERDVARREERQKLARDLHDSVVQQVFSMMMQARSLGVLVERGLAPPPEKVAQVADDLSSSAEDVLADLRGMVVELRPATGTERGLVSALQLPRRHDPGPDGAHRGAGRGRSRRGAGPARRRPARGRLPHRRGGAAQQRQARRRRTGWSSTCRSPPTAAAGASSPRSPMTGAGSAGAPDRGQRPGLQRPGDDRDAGARGPLGRRRPRPRPARRRGAGCSSPCRC